MAATVRAYIQSMSKGALFIVIVLAAILAAVLYSTANVWMSIGGGAGMNGNGVAALIIGGIGTLLLGGGLMALVFFSSRRGYDDAADFRHDSDKL
ncbi:MAG TPA: hypothetical protein VL899_15885 [Alphaproteobacteria bacterium]|nr:hypothetical protein [Alphaproteobacteria bacterium]